MPSKKEKVKKKINKWTDKKKFLIYCPIYDTDFLFFINYSEKEIYHWLSKNSTKKENIEWFKENVKMDETWVATKGRMYPLPMGFIINLQTKGKGFRQFISLAVHEISHCVHYKMRDIRMPLEENTEEAYTYLIQFLVYEFLVALYK